MQSKSHQISTKIWSKLVEFVSDLICDLTCLILWSDLIGSHQIEILDQISWSHFWLLFLDQISWSIFPITLWSAWFEFPSNLVELPVRSDLWSQLTWSFDLIWSDLIGCDQIPIIDLISWSHFLFKFVDQISWSICPIMISFHTDLFKFLVQLCWSFFSISSLSVRIVFSPRSNFLFKFVDPPFRSCAFFFWPLVRSPSMDIDGSWLVYIYIYIYIYMYIYIYIYIYIY